MTELQRSILARVQELIEENNDLRNKVKFWMRQASTLAEHLRPQAEDVTIWPVPEKPITCETYDTCWIKACDACEEAEKDCCHDLPAGEHSSICEADTRGDAEYHEKSG